MGYIRTQWKKIRSIWEKIRSINEVSIAEITDHKAERWRYQCTENEQKITLRYAISIRHWHLWLCASYTKVSSDTSIARNIKTSKRVLYSYIVGE